jgi:hypothetical protein
MRFNIFKLILNQMENPQYKKRKINIEILIGNQKDFKSLALHIYPLKYCFINFVWKTLYQ